MTGKSLALAASLLVASCAAAMAQELDLASCLWAIDESKPPADKQMRSCIWALYDAVIDLQGRLVLLEGMDAATDVDIQRLYNWTHCHGGQAECAALQDRGLQQQGR